VNRPSLHAQLARRRSLRRAVRKLRIHYEAELERINTSPPRPSPVYVAGAASTLEAVLVDLRALEKETR
jgi:hypothetical protein